MPPGVALQPLEVPWAWPEGPSTSLGRLEATHPPRPGLAEVLAGVRPSSVPVAVEVWVTAARLPVGETLQRERQRPRRPARAGRWSSSTPERSWPSRVLAVLAERLRGRLAIVATVGAVLCAVVVWPGVVEQSDLDAKPVNALPALVVLIAVALDSRCAHRGGIGASRPFGGGRAVARAVLAVVLVLGSLPWLERRDRLLPTGIPGPGALFMSGELRPEPGHPNLTAVHLGHHHGMDGTLLALSALAFAGGRGCPHPLPRGPSRSTHAHARVRPRNAFQDFWFEQQARPAGTAARKIPSMIVPSPRGPWLALVAAALLIRSAAAGVE